MESNRRSLINEIQKMNISSSEKAKLIFQVMNPNLNNDKLEISNKKRSYCHHYNLTNYYYAKCCKKIYPCRNCHDENEDHKIDRHGIEYMKCDFCDCLQKVNSHCINPDCYQFKKDHKYFCGKCNLWFNDTDKLHKFLNSILIIDIDCTKQVFHCDKCNICRLGKKEDYKHCDKCNLCLKKDYFDNHPCKVNMKEQNCPICLKSIWDSHNQHSSLLKCGHSVHQNCLQNALSSGNYFCALCKKSMIDLTAYWQFLDQSLENQQMPEEYSNWTSDIHCNDCLKKSTTKYHFMYHKCNNCNGYNTSIDKINKI